MTGPFSPIATIQGADAPSAIVAGSGFWPDIDLAQIRAAIRVDQTVTEDRLRGLVRSAMLDIMSELGVWEADQKAAGYSSLAAVPGRRLVDGQTDYQIRWFQAVHSVVAADLGDRLLGPSARSAGLERADELGSDIDVHRRNVTYAVRDFLGHTRIIAEAI